MEYVKQQGSITNKIYRELFNVSKRFVTKELQELVTKGILQQKGKGRGTHYVMRGLD